VSDGLAADRVLAQLRAAHRVARVGSWAASLRARDEPYQWSPEVREILGWPADQPPPAFGDLVALVHPDDRAKLFEARASATSKARPYRVDLRIVRPDGQVRHLHIAAEVVRDADGRRDRLVGVLQDRTEEVEALRRLRITEASRRQLLQRLLDTADRERERLARQLEDRAAADLRAVEALLAEAIDEDAPPAWHDVLDSVRRSIASLDATLTSMTDPGTHGDLAAVVADLAGDLPDLPVHADVEVPSPPSPAVRSVVVRVVQEALQNARKHAGASTATVSVRGDGDTVHVTVTDDGRGFDVDAVPPAGAHGHFGLASLREDVAAVGGTFEVRSRPGRTIVEARLPAR